MNNFINGIEAAQITLLQTEPRVSFEVGLGQSFIFLDFVAEDAPARLQALGLDDEQVAVADYVFSNETPPSDYGENGLLGRCARDVGTIILYPNNALTAVRERYAAGEAHPIVLSAVASLIISANTAHEESHYADFKKMGQEGMDAELLQHNLPIILEQSRSHKRKLLATIGAAMLLEAGFIVAGTQIESDAPAYGSLAIGLGSVVAALGIQLWQRRRLHNALNSVQAYLARPGEQRAQAVETAYADAALAGGVMPIVQAIPRAEFLTVFGGLYTPRA